MCAGVCVVCAGGRECLHGALKVFVSVCACMHMCVDAHVVCVYVLLATAT